VIRANLPLGIKQTRNVSYVGDDPFFSDAVRTTIFIDVTHDGKHHEVVQNLMNTVAVLMGQVPEMHQKVPCNHETWERANGFPMQRYCTLCRKDLEDEHDADCGNQKCLQCNDSRS